MESQDSPETVMLGIQGTSHRTGQVTVAYRDTQPYGHWDETTAYSEQVALGMKPSHPDLKALLLGGVN